MAGGALGVSGSRGKESKGSRVAPRLWWPTAHVRAQRGKKHDVGEGRRALEVLTHILQ